MNRGHRRNYTILTDVTIVPQVRTLRSCIKGRCREVGFEREGRL